MKKLTVISFMVVVIMLLSSFTFAKATSLSDSIDVVNQFTSLSKEFSSEVANSEWIHAITSTQFIDRPSVQMEDWYHLEPSGEIAEIYEWATFGDFSTPSQESMMKNGIWMNLSSNQKWSASTTVLDFSAGFRGKLSRFSENNEKISESTATYTNIPAVKFSLETEDSSDKNIKGYREDYYLNADSGKPLGNEVYQLNIDGNEVLVQKTIFLIDTGTVPPPEKLKEIESKVESNVSGFTDLHSSNGVILPAYTYYKTTSRSQQVTVSGLAITSYKTLYIHTSFWDGIIYTGTPSTILQQAGANWFSFQEYCNGPYYNIYISTTPDISTGVSSWSRATGAVYYMSGCSTSHELYINGSHYAKYNNTIMNPSPDFAIWYPVALS